MSNVFVGVILLSGVAAVYFLIRVIIAAVKKAPVAPVAKKIGIAIAVGIVGFVGFGVTQTPEERAEIKARQEARQQAEADKKVADEKAAEEKRIADEKAAAERKAQEETKRLAEEEQRRQKQAEFEAAQKERQHNEMIQEITTGWNMATTDTDNNHSNWEKATDLVKKYPDYIHGAGANYIDANDAMKKPWDYYGKVVNLSGRVYSIEQLPPGNSVAKFFGGNCYHAMLAVGEGYDPVTLSMYIVGDSSGLVADSIINVKGYIFGHVKLVNRLGGELRGLAFVGFNE